VSGPGRAVPSGKNPRYPEAGWASELDWTHRLEQGLANYGPRAKYGPLRGSMRPAEGLENAKKNEVSKNI
jgi:hypothetical protein